MKSLVDAVFSWCARLECEIGGDLGREVPSERLDGGAGCRDSGGGSQRLRPAVVCGGPSISCETPRKVEETAVRHGSFPLSSIKKGGGAMRGGVTSHGELFA